MTKLEIMKAMVNKMKSSGKGIESIKAVVPQKYGLEEWWEKLNIQQMSVSRYNHPEEELKNFKAEADWKLSRGNKKEKGKGKL